MRRLREHATSETNRAGSPATIRHGGPRICAGAGAAALFVWASASTCVIPISSAQVSADAGGGGTDASVEGGSSAGSDAASPPSGSWTNVTANLANMPSQCGNMSYLSAKPDEDLLIAGIALDGLWASRDGGGSWSALGVSDASTSITNSTSSIVYDPQNADRFWESGFHDIRGVYETTDDGATFAELGDAPQIDLVGIDFSDPNRQTLLAGAHEMPQTLLRSTDGGTTWSNVGAGLPANTDCSFPLVQDSVTHFVGCDGEGGGPAGIYRTTDGGITWTSMTSLGGTAAPLVASDGSIYWSSPDGAGIARSTDQGQTWYNTVTAEHALLSLHPIELPDGRIATIGPQYNTQYVLVSADHGTTWNPASAALPFSDAVGVAYSSQRKAFYVWHFSCVTATDPVPPDAIISFAFDYQKS